MLTARSIKVCGQLVYGTANLPGVANAETAKNAVNNSPAKVLYLVSVSNSFLEKKDIGFHSK